MEVAVFANVLVNELRCTDFIGKAVTFASWTLLRFFFFPYKLQNRLKRLSRTNNIVRHNKIAQIMCSGCCLLQLFLKT